MRSRAIFAFATLVCVSTLGLRAQSTPVPEAAASGAPSLSATESADAVARISALNERIASMTGELDAAEKKLADAAGELESEKAARAADAEAAGLLKDDLLSAIDASKAEMEGLKARLSDRDGLADRLAALESEKGELAAKLGADRGGIIDLADWPRLLVSGFEGAKPRIGKWTLSSTTAEQTNAKEFFSRLDLPLGQRNRPYLYRFSASTDGAGWVGLGLHFFASEVKARRGYGEGRSLLLWFTRDPAIRKTDATWLQLYRSDSDVLMERVLDAKLEEGLGSLLNVEAIYDPSSGILSVTINSRLAVRYRAWFGIEQGLGVSLRTLGSGGKFSGFEVRTMEE
ncbi:MAG: hypothetical protein WCL50_10130 [Spirochaetota bacterium]